MLFNSAILLALGLGAAALPHSVSRSADGSSSLPKVLIGGGASGSVLVAEFDRQAGQFSIVANNTIEGTLQSWLLFRPNSTNLYSVDEDSNITRLFNVDLDKNEIALVQEEVANPGIVFLGFNQDKTRMAGAAFGSGFVDLYDVSSPDGTMSLLVRTASNDTIGNNKAQTGDEPHEIQIDPTGHFWVAQDRGSDRILVLSADNDAFAITNDIQVPTPGSGPRHGVFYPPGAPVPTHYFVVCELSDAVDVFELTYTEETILMTPTQIVSTFDLNDFPSNVSTSAAGEIQISPDGKHVYVSNRLSGHDSDNIVHFVVCTGSDGSVSLELRDSVLTGGQIPRMFSFGVGDLSDVLFVANQGGELGIAALTINSDGSVDPNPIASLPLEVFAQPGTDNGPEFIQLVDAF